MDVWTVVGVLVCVWLACQIIVGLFAPFQSTRKKVWHWITTSFILETYECLLFE